MTEPMDWTAARLELEHWLASLCNPRVAEALRLAIELAEIAAQQEAVC